MRLLTLLTSLLLSFAQNDSQPLSVPVITIENASQLRPVFSFFGGCEAFSPDSEMVYIDNWGIFKTFSGTPYFSTPHLTQYGRHLFSPNGELLAVVGDALYEVDTGKRRFPLSSPALAFSPDSSMLILSDGVYDTETGQLLTTVGDGYFSADGQYGAFNAEQQSEIQVVQFPSRQVVLQIPNPNGYWWKSSFSQNGRYFYVRFATSPAQVYDLSSGTLVFELSVPQTAASFSQDGSLMAIPKVGVFETGSWNRRFSFDYSDDEGRAIFSPDGQFVAMEGNGIYNLSNDEKLFSFNSGIAWGPNSDLVVLSEGLYSLSGERLAPLPRGSAVFSADGSLIAVSIQQVHNVRDQSYQGSSACVLYAVDDGSWPYGTGLIDIDSQIDLYSTPMGNNISNVSGTHVVFAKSLDEQWLALFTPVGVEFEDSWQTYVMGWVRASDVNVLYLSENLPTDLRMIWPLAWLEDLPGQRVVANEPYWIVIADE